MRIRRRSRALARDLFDRDDMLMLVAPRIPDEDREGADQAEDRQPPDVPDDGEAAERGEEGDDHPGRRVQRHFDRLVIGLLDQLILFDRRLLARPIGLFAMDVGEHREIIVRRRRQRQPFERPPVPRVAGDVAPLLARADRIDELDEGQRDGAEDQHRADQRDDIVGLPARIVIMLQPPRRAHQKPSA